MENQDVKEIQNNKISLKRYRKNIACIARLEEKLFILDEKIKSVRSPNLSGMPRGGTPITTEDLIADKEELELRIKRLKERTRKLKSDILAIIDSIDDERYCEILEAYFIDGLTLETIAANMGYTERRIYTFYKEALTKLEKIS